MNDEKQTPSATRIEHVGLVNKDGQWYSRVGVAEGNEAPHPAEIIENGYTCRDGVWYKCLALSNT